MVKKAKTFTHLLQLMTLLSAGAPVFLLGSHWQAQRQAKKEGQATQTWLKSRRFHKALHWDLVFCYLVFLIFAHREARAGRTKDPFWFYAALSTLWGVSPAFPVLLLRHQHSKEKEN